ncbi:MAG: C40 family peptidase [Acetatifactor sp.]|nr:C40 family peptidase [Acetatifactor sp.]
MKSCFRKTTVYLAAALLVLGGMSMDAQAAGSVLPSGGVGIFLSKGTKLEEVSSNLSSPVETIVVQEDLEKATENLRMQEEAEALSKTVVAQVNRFACIHGTPADNGEFLGKFYNEAVGTLVAEEGDWLLITSGSVTGYVKKQYCVAGEEAAELAKQVGTRVATVEAATLYVRTEADGASEVLCMVPEGEELLVLEETEGWAKVDVEEGQGWISTEYANVHSNYVTAESKEEEIARIARETQERQKARAAAKKTTQKVDYEVGEGSEMGKAVVEYALQFVGNPYVFGGTSLTDGTDCSGFVMKVYENFGVTLPHSSKADRTEGYAVESLEDALPGDLICYSGHVALYMGNDQIVHASNSKTGIIVSKVNYRKILAIRRIF